MTEFVALVLRNNGVEKVSQLPTQRLVKLEAELWWDMNTGVEGYNAIYLDWADVKDALREKGIEVTH